MITSVGFFTCVCTSVNFQVFTRDECLPTHITNISFFPCVYSNMNHKRCFTRQCLVTNTAHVVTLSCVCSHVQSERTSLQENLTTNFTLVFLYRKCIVWVMLSFMKCQIMFVWISLATHITLKWLLTCVNILVLLQLCIGVKPFSTHTTMEFVVTEMSLEMIHQI